MIFKTQLKYLIFMLIGVVLSCKSPLRKGLDLGKPAKISEAQPSASVIQGEGIKLIAIPLKKTLELGEPVYIAVHVINKGQKPVNIAGGLHPGEGLMEVYSIDANGEKVELPPMGEGDAEGIITLEPDQTIGAVFPIFFGANGWNFTKAGEYHISVELKIPDKDGFLNFSSEPAIIKVESSKAGRVLFEGKEINNSEAGKFLLWRSGDHLEEGLKLLASLSDQHPNSVLSSYILSAQAHNYSEPFANYLKGEVRVPDCKMADSLRKMINPDVLTENLLIEDYISQAKCHAVNQNWEKAKKALDAGAELCTDRPEFMAYYQSMEKMQNLLKKYLE